MGTQRHSVGTALFMNLNADIVFNDLDVNKTAVFDRAIQTLLISYVGYSACGEQTKQIYYKYRKRYVEYMLKVFDLEHLDVTDVINVVENQIKTWNIIIYIAVLEAKGDIGVQSVNVRIKADTGMARSNYQTESIILDLTKEKQTHNPFKAVISLESLKQLKAYNRVINISVFDGQTESNRYVLPYRDIHVEGFMDWLEFQIGPEKAKLNLLTKVAFGCDSDPTSETWYHTRLLFFMLDYKIYDFRGKATEIEKWHMSYGQKRKTDCLRKAIKTHTSNAYWLKPAAYSLIGTSSDINNDSSDWNSDGNIDNFSDYLKNEGLFGRTAKYHDLNIGHSINEKPSIESFCVCNEWCNLSSFFYHNPIIRFVMTQHNQLFMTNIVPIADIYLCTISYIMSFQIHTKDDRTPLFGLLQSAHNYSEQNFMKLFTDPEFGQKYILSKSSTFTFIALAYHLLRFSIEPSIVSQTAEGKLFSHNIINNVRIYYDVLNYLHPRICENYQFVARNDQKEWHKELENDAREWFHDVVRNGVGHYITNTYELHSEALFSYDYVMNAKNNMLKSGYDQIMKYRNKVIVLETNPYNVKFTCERHLSILVIVSNFISGVEPSLTKVYDSHGLNKEIAFVTWLDDNFNSIYKVSPATRARVERDFTARIVQRHGSDWRLPLNELHLYQYYTLKTYCVAYNIQEYCVSSIIAYTSKRFFTDVCVTKILNFVFRNTWIELSLTKRFPNQLIFKMDWNLLGANFFNFYLKYWKRAKSEVVTNLTDIQVYEDFVYQYKRLYHWWKMRGNETIAFKALFNGIRDLIECVFQTSESMFMQNIVKIFREDKTNYPYKIEVVDVLVYWLAKADCYLLVCVVNTLLKLVLMLQNDRLLQYNRNFTQSKPGLVYLFRSHKTILKHLDRIKQYYIGFDDEFDRVSITLDNTKKQIKALYRDIYKKFANDYIRENEELFDLPQMNSNDERVVVLLIKLNLIAGLTFFANFVHDFRKDFHRLRKRMSKIPSTGPAVQFLHQQVFVFFLRQCSDHWYSNFDQILEATPFMSAFWRTYMIEFYQFDQLDPINDLDL